VAKAHPSEVDVSPEEPVEYAVSEPLPSDAPAPDAPPAMGLEEWCRRASESRNGVELLAGFYADAMAAGLTRASAAEFKAAFDEFGRRPA
jgi:hypothetical protein